MKVDLHYGKGLVSLQIPEENIEEIIEPWHGETEADNAAILGHALSGQEADDFQKEIAGKRLCVLAEDGTRGGPFNETLLGLIFDVIRGSPETQLVISTGTHDPKTPENSRITKQMEKAGRKAGIANFKIHVHDCQQDSFIRAGKTSRGTEVIFSAKIDNADVFLVLSDMKTHYFAGYSNPIKSFVPGVCGFQTTEHNHSLSLDDNSTFGLHPWHNDLSRRNNPLAQDQLEAMQMIIKDRPVYVLGTISTSGRIQWARFGPVQSVTREAFDKIDERNTHTVTPVPYLVVSPGGLPNDVTLYIAQRALELTKNGVCDDGQVLFLVACPDGIGEERTMEHFYNLLTAPIEQILKSIENEYKLYSHKAYKFAQMIGRLRRIWMHSQIVDDLVEAAHLYPVHQPQEVVDNWLGQDPHTRITVVDGANKIALYAKKKQDSAPAPF